MAVMRLSIAKFFVAILSFFTLSKMLALKRLKFSLVWIILFGLGINQSKAQIHLEESFKNNTKSNIVTLGGSATLTAITNINEHNANNGWLRLTPDERNKSGYAIVDKAFSSQLGIIIEFGYKTWGNFSKGESWANTKPGDGLAVFLYDGSLQFKSSDIGPYGGPLGYAARTGSKNALNKGYVCIGFDEYGNFSSSKELNGGLSTNLVPQAIGVRGPSGRNRDQSIYIGGTSTTLAGTSIQGKTIGYSISTTTRPTDDEFYRKARIILLPTTRNSKNDFKIEVQLQIEPLGEFYTVIKDVFVGELPPLDLKIGFAASTGGAVANHEIRDVKITTPVNFAIAKTASKIAANAKSDIITYKLLVANVGNNSAEATITDILPRGLTLVNRSISFTTTNEGPSNFKTNGTNNNDALIDMSVYLPSGASGIITYRAQTNVNDPSVLSLINTATITPPNGFSDQNLNDNISTAEVFIKPVLINKDIEVCSGEAISIPLTATSPNNANIKYEWTAKQYHNGSATGFQKSGTASVITETFLAEKNNEEDEEPGGSVVYTVTPTIIVNNRTIKGDAKTFTVNVKPRTPKFDNYDLNDSDHKTYPISIRLKDNATGKPIKDVIYRFYADETTSTILHEDNNRDEYAEYIMPTKFPGNLSCYVSSQRDNFCEGERSKITIDVKHHIFLSYDKTSVMCGSQVIITASLSNTLVAPPGGITVTLTESNYSNTTTKAIIGKDYIALPAIYIPAGKHAASNTIVTRCDPNTTEQRTLAIDAASTGGYDIPNQQQQTILINIPKQPISLKFTPEKVDGGQSSTLRAELPNPAPTGGITISLHKVGGNLVETFSDHIYITTGQTSASITVTTKVNTGAISQLIVTGPSNLPGYTLNSPATLTIEPTKPEIINSQLTNTICSGDPIGISLSSTLLNTTYRWTAKSSSTNITGFTNGNGVDINQVLTNNGATSETVTYTVVPVIRINDLEEVAGNSKDFVITVMPRTKTDTNSSHNLNDDNIKSETHNTDKFYDIDEIVDIKNQPGITYRWYHDLDPTTKPTLGNFNQLDIPIGPVGSQTYYYTKQEDGFCESGRTQVTLHITRNITLKFDQPNVQGGQSSTLIANLPTANETGQDIIIDIQQTSGDAKDKIQYTKPEQFQIIIKAGASSGSVEVGTILATQLLGQKTAVVTGKATNYTFGGPATLTISDRSEDKVITLKFDGDGTVQGGNLATLTASLPDNIKAPQGGITIVITNTPGLDRNSARKSRDFKARDLPQDIYIKAGESSGFIHIQTIDDSQPGVRNVIRPLTVMGTPNVGTMASPSTVLEIDQSDYPVGIKMSLYSGYNSDKAGEITSGYTAYLKIRPELSNAKKIPKYDYIIKLNVSNTPGRTEAVMGKHYDLTGIDPNGEQITQTITFNFNRNKEVIIPLFIAQKTNVIGEKKRLEFNPIVSNGDNFTPVFITIVENPPTEILLDFIPSSVNAGDPSILIAKFDQSKKDVGSPDITSIKDNEIKLVPSGNALSGTHYNGLPTSITIPAGRNSISVTIPTVDTREVNIPNRELKATGNSTDGYTIQNAPVLTIKYPTVPLPTIDNTKLEYEICSGSPFSITFNTNPKNDTRCVWTAEVKNGVTGASENTMGGNSIVDVLKNTGATPGKVIYTVTPITTTANGTKVKGDPKKIVVTVLPISAKINDNSWTLKDVNGLYSSPVDPKPKIIYTWYDKDNNQIHNSTGIDAQCHLPISEPGTYTYYMTQTEPDHCPGDFGKITITLTRSITLSFDTPTVGGGSQAKLTAKLAPGITAPIGGVDILLTPTTDHSTTAKNGANYIGLIDKITIPAGENSITIDAFTATNNHIIDGSTQLTLEGTGPMGYDINKPNPTIILLDKTGDYPKAKLITLAFDKHLVKGGDEAILTISLPKGVTSALPITITLGKVKDKSRAKRNINYRTYPDFITIPANKNHVEYHLKTLSEGDFGDIKSLWVNGKASGYRINTDGINIKNPDKIHIPNVFTPNDDGENDFWIITGIESYPKCTVRVYNRWGKRVFFSIGYAQPWDGKQSDQPLPVATYYYVIDLKNGSKPISGHVAIVR